MADAQSQGLSVHPHDAVLSSQQFDPGMGITTRSMSNNESRLARRGSAPQQLTAFPYNVGDKLFETRFSDSDKDNWGEVLSGREAHGRAMAHAEQTGEKVGFGVRQHAPDAKFPEGTSRVKRMPR